MAPQGMEEGAAAAAAGLLPSEAQAGACPAVACCCTAVAVVAAEVACCTSAAGEACTAVEGEYLPGEPSGGTAAEGLLADAAEEPPRWGSEV